MQSTDTHAHTRTHARTHAHTHTHTHTHTRTRTQCKALTNTHTGVKNHTRIPFSSHFLPPTTQYLNMSHLLMRVSLVERGHFFMISRSAGLKLRAVAGKPSVTRLTQSNWTGIRASGTPRAAAKKMLKK